MKAKQMTTSEMNDFIENINRAELEEELQNYNKCRKCPLARYKYPKYLKAIRVSLIALGYDEDWVCGPFRDALEKRYFKKRYRKNNKLTSE